MHIFKISCHSEKEQTTQLLKNIFCPYPAFMDNLGGDVEEEAGRHWEIGKVRSHQPGSLCLAATQQAHCQGAGWVRRFEICSQGKFHSSIWTIKPSFEQFGVCHQILHRSMKCLDFDGLVNFKPKNTYFHAFICYLGIFINCNWEALFLCIFKQLGIRY